MISPQRESTVLLLAGGGIDSTLCMHLLKSQNAEFRALHVDYGQPAAVFEWAAVQSACASLNSQCRQVKVSGALLNNGPEVLGRNAALIFLALMYRKLDEKLVCIGIHSGTSFADCSAVFYKSVAQLVAEQSDSRVQLIAPLLNLNKPEIVSKARDLNITISETYSCQRGTKPPCGKCHSCKDREALEC